tara:strand:+ start:247 stop:1356 length:1110 start_codon:yes stop_codon:yes gene_type:complete
VYTFSSQALGTAASDRLIVVSSDNYDGTTSGITVAGVAATAVIQASGTNSRAGLWQAAVPSGTTGDIVVTLGAGNDRLGIGVWAIYGAANSSANDTATDEDSSDPLTVSMDCPANGVMICAAAAHTTGTKGYSWTNLTENFDAVIKAATQHTGASALFETAQSGLTITCDPASNTNGGCMAAASWASASDGVPAYITLEADDWQGDTGSATLGDGTAILTAGDKNIRTNDTLIPEGVDFDFEAAFGVTGGSSQFMGVADNGTGTGAQQPTSTNPVFYARNGSSNQGWTTNNTAVEAAKSDGWFGNSVIGFSRRGATIYGMIDGSVDRTFTGATTSKAIKFWFGASGTGAWNVGATNIRYRRGGGLPTLS